jgi:FkbM family methyltransferase
MHVPWRKRISRIIRGKLRASVLSSHGEGILANSKNGLLIVDPRDFGVSRSLLNHGSYDWEAIEWLARTLDSRSRIVVVGAHLGAVLIPLAVRSQSQSIIAFEPSPRNHRLLTLNLVLNGLHAVSVRRCAAGNSQGVVRFTENQINSGNSRVSSNGNVEVEVSPLDRALPGAEAISLLIMDTEGFEVQAMRGAGATLGRTDCFYVEFAPEQLIEQGSDPGEFIDLAAQHFTSMYVPGDPVRFFPDKTFVRFLRELPRSRGLLMNLLFTNDPEPRAVLMS